MPAKTGTPEVVANRCTCGHYPSTHMVVRPGGTGSVGSWILLPLGPCVRCGAACTKFTPTA